MYGEIKSHVFNVLPISMDANLIAFGLFFWLISGLVFRLPMTKMVAVVPVIIIAVAMELADVILLGQAPIKAVSDMALVCAAPLIVVFFQHQGWARS